MFLRRAMRYYRLWIYTCNAVLLVSVIVFLGVSAGVISHPYIALIPTPAPYHPSLLYGYVALFLQAGVLQAIGCFGALRLCQKLLSTYWLLLLSLLLGDLLVGLIWLIKLSHLTEGIRPFLINTIKNQYNKDTEITEVWDSLQMNHQCCGVQSPFDYNNISSFFPDSCCHLSTLPSRYNIHKTDHVLRYISSRRQVNVKDDQNSDNSTKLKLSKMTSKGESQNQTNITCKANGHLPYYKGCAAHVIKWYKDSTETIMIFGFCVITFIKLCFVGILRFEIQEMIQKIKVLHGEAASAPNPELAEALGMVSPERKVEGGLLVNSEDQNLLIKETPQHLLRHNHISTQIDGAESDTNSHCALLTDTPIRNQHLAKRKQNGNNNEITELRELCHIKQTQI